MLRIDGKSFPAVYIVQVSRRPQRMTDGGITLQDGTTRENVIGIKIVYDILIDAGKSSAAEYDELFEILTEPIEFHSFVLPYAQSEIEFIGRVTIGGDVLYRSFAKNNNAWGNLSITIEPQKPQREALSRT